MSNSKHTQNSRQGGQTSDAKRAWTTPILQELSFRDTENGAGAFPEGTIGGNPVGTQS